jgi:hypothetical protein
MTVPGGVVDGALARATRAPTFGAATPAQR